MNNVSFISNEIINALGATLVHSIWQAAIIGLVLLVILRMVPKSNAQLKYWLALTALAGVVFWGGYTLKEQVQSIRPYDIATAEQLTALWEISPNLAVAQNYGLGVVQNYTLEFMTKLQPYMTTLVVVWFLGALLLLVRLQGSMIYLSKLRRSQLQPLPQDWVWKVQELAHQLRIHKTIQIAESALAQVPMVIGHIKPIILLPVGIITGLPAREVEAVIAHELAHVKRYDYLINILQTIVESLLFFNPVVWWISQVIRKQREHCCDDLAVKCCGNHLIYAHALTNLGAWSLQTPSMSMGLFKSKGELLQRVKRLVYPHHRASIKEKWIPAMILGVAITCLTWYSLKVQAQLQPATPTLEANSQTLEAFEELKYVTDVAWDTLPSPKGIDEDIEEVDPPVIAEEQEWVEEDYLTDFEFVMPDVDFDFVMPDFEVMVPDFDFDVMVSPDIVIPPIPDITDAMVDIETIVDVELPQIFMDLQEAKVFAYGQLNDTTRKKIEEALESQREALDRARVEQAEALERAREKLRESLEQERPEDLTEEEWEEAKQQIRRAERSLERAMEQSERSLERALMNQERELSMHLEHARRMRDQQKMTREHLRRAHRHERERMAREIAREHRHMARRTHESKLRHELVEDGLLDHHDSDLKLVFKKDLIKINGKQIKDPLKEKYRDILDEMYGSGSQGELEFSN